MADDWAEKYVEVHNQEQQEKRQREQDDRERRRLAEAGAREKFHQVRERIDQDLQILRSAVMFHSVELDKSLGERLTVIHRGAPRIELNVNLNVTTIVCEYKFYPKEGSKGNQAKREPKTLRICSDLDGRITVHKNGDEQAFAHDSEVSEFLLAPLLTHIISQ